MYYTTIEFGRKQFHLSPVAITMCDRWRLPKGRSIAGTSSETNFIDDDSDEIPELNPVI